MPVWLRLTLVFTPTELPTPQIRPPLAKLGLVSEKSCSPLLFRKVECVELGVEKAEQATSSGEMQLWDLTQQPLDTEVQTHPLLVFSLQ